MNLKHVAGAVLVAAVPLAVALPVFADSTTLAVYGDPSASALVEVAGVQTDDPAYAARLAGWPQPGGVRIQPGMVSTRALIRSDQQNGAGAAEVAGVRAAGVDVAGVQSGQVADAEYASRVLAYPQLGTMRVQPGMVGLHSLQRQDSLWPPEVPFGANE
jgi:hypothetical protein